LKNHCKSETVCKNIYFLALSTKRTYMQW
jgi:hypothetical protein